jgi:RHS repeat-associated protein
MPQGLGRYGVELASYSDSTSTAFEWYLKNHLGSTMAVYGTTGTASSPELKHAYDYRSFGEQIDLTKRNDKVTENFTGKEKDDETELNYFGARYLDPMLGIWTSVDPARQFVSPYLYVGNGANPINGMDGNGNVFVDEAGKGLYQKAVNNNFWGDANIRREYEFANSTSTKISLRRQEGLIGPEEHAGETMESVYDQMNLMYGVNDDYKMLGATVTLSNEGSRGWSDYLNVTFDEAEARTAAHEFGAHIRMFSPKTPANDREREEHDKYSDIDKRLKTPRDQCPDYE